MSKALELFEQIENIDENKYYKTRTIVFDRDDMEFLYEAKTELEAQEEKLNCYSAIVGSKNEEIALLKDKIKEFETQKTKSCNTCKNSIVNLGICLKRVQLNNGYLPKTFSCVWYE